MAAAGEIGYSESAESYTHCVFCDDTKRPTRLLLCFHPICDTCLVALGIEVEGKVECEICSTTTDIRGTGRDHTALRPNDFQHVWASFTQLFEAKPCVVCSSLDKKMMGTHVCLDCGQDYLCKECLSVHASLGGTKHHQPVPLPSLKDAKWSQKLRGRCHEICDKHHVVMKFYCLVCQTLVCHDCLHLDHFDHKRVGMSDYCDERRLHVEYLNKALDDKLQYTTWQKAEFERLVEESRMNEITGINEIAERVEALKKMLDEWGKQKTEELQAFYQTTREQHESSASYWKTASAPLESMSTFSKLFLQYATDKDLLKSLDTLEKGITAVLKDREDVGVPLRHKTLKLQWKSLDDIRNKLETFAGTAVRYERLAIKRIDEVSYPTDEVIFGLAITQEQDILASGVSKDEVYVFDSKGLYKHKISFQNPIAAWNVVTYGGEIYVSDDKERQVKRIDKDGKPTHTIQLRGNVREEGYDRIGLSVDPRSGLLYICSKQKNTVYRCALDDEIAEPLITPHCKPPLCRPDYLHVTPTGDIVVTNVEGHNVHIYSTDGQLKQVLGKKGGSLGQFNQPVGVSTDASGYMFVADLLNHRVQVVAASRDFIGWFPAGDKDFKTPVAVRVDRRGDVLVSHSKDKISIFRPIRSCTAKQFSNNFDLVRT